MAKKILVFVDWFLPGYKAGGPIRSVANLTAHLSGEFEFFIVTRNTDYLETEAYADVEPNKWIDFAENVKVFYFSADKLSVDKSSTTIQLSPDAQSSVNESVIETEEKTAA